MINYTLKPGGTERYFSELSNCLSSEGYSITIVLLKKDEIFFRLNEKIRIIEPRFETKKTLFCKAMYFFRLIPYIRKNIKDLRPSLIINAAFPFFFLTAVSGIKVPVVIAIRCDPRRTEMIDGFRIPLWIRKNRYNRSAVILAQTLFAAGILSKQFQKPRIVVIPNVLGRMPSIENPREKIIISAGRLIRGKGFDYLIRSFCNVNPADWKLMILGEGPEEQNLKDLIKSLGLEGKATIQGNKPDVFDYFSRSSIFAFTSLSEGFPNVLLEAMATPLACISFDIDSGPRELIKNGENGFLIRPKDIGGFASKLMMLVNDADLRKSFMNEAVKVRESHSWAGVRHHYVDLIDSLKN